jgi:hypothetical protein
MMKHLWTCLFLAIIAMPMQAQAWTRSSSATSISTLSISCDKKNNAQLNYPNLETVGTLNINFDDCQLSSANFPKLRSIAQTLKIRLDDSSFVGFRLPALESVGKLDVVADDSTLRAFSLGASNNP